MRDQVRSQLPALGAIAAMVVAGAVFGAIAAGSLGARPPDATPTAVAVAVPTASATPSPRPTPRPSPRPTPTPSPTPSPSPSVELTAEPETPTADPGSSDLPPGMPPVAIDGADPAAVAAIQRAVHQLRDAHAYAFEDGIAGRSVVDLSSSIGGSSFGARGTVTDDHGQSADLLVAFTMAEPDNSAAITSTSRLIVVGDEAWEVRQQGAKPTKIPNGQAAQQTLEILLPPGLAERIVLPFAGGFRRVGREEHGGVSTDHYRATAAGIAAYEGVTGIRGDWTAELWIARGSGALVGAEIHGATADGTDGFTLRLEVTRFNDPKLVVKRPA